MLTSAFILSTSSSRRHVLTSVGGRLVGSLRMAWRGPSVDFSWKDANGNKLRVSSSTRMDKMGEILRDFWPAV